MEYVNSVAPTDDVRWLHTRLDVFNDAEVEMHFMPSYLECPWQNRALQRFFDSEKEACFASGKCTDRFNQVFILAHAFRHLFSEGVGMRQLMDYYFVLKNSGWRQSTAPPAFHPPDFYIRKYRNLTADAFYGLQPEWQYTSDGIYKAQQRLRNLHPCRCRSLLPL